MDERAFSPSLCLFRWPIARNVAESLSTPSKDSRHQPTNKMMQSYSLLINPAGSRHLILGRAYESGDGRILYCGDSSPANDSTSPRSRDLSLYRLLFAVANSHSCCMTEPFLDGPDSRQDIVQTISSSRRTKNNVHLQRVSESGFPQGLRREQGESVSNICRQPPWCGLLGRTPRRTRLRWTAWPSTNRAGVTVNRILAWTAWRKALGRTASLEYPRLTRESLMN
jgi:hypothetical protein